MDIKYANHPDDSKKYSTEELRTHYLQEKIFEKDKFCLTYSHVDRIIFGGTMPVDTKLILAAADELYSDEKDVTFYENASHHSELNLKDGYFGVFFPEDGHKPGCIFEKPMAIKKVVVKIKV